MLTCLVRYILCHRLSKEKIRKKKFMLLVFIINEKAGLLKENLQKVMLFL